MFITVPSVPNATFVTQTTDSITLTVKKGSGIVKSYEIYVNDEFNHRISYTNSSQQVDVKNLTAGTMYNLTVVSISNNFKSQPSALLMIATCK